MERQSHLRFIEVPTYSWMPWEGRSRKSRRCYPTPSSFRRLWRTCRTTRQHWTATSVVNSSNVIPFVIIDTLWRGIEVPLQCLQFEVVALVKEHRHSSGPLQSAGLWRQPFMQVISQTKGSIACIPQQLGEAHLLTATAPIYQQCPVPPHLSGRAGGW